MNNIIHAAVDIECTDVDPSSNAGILSVGIVAFTVKEIIDRAEWRLDPVWTPGSRSKSTYTWWQDQDAITKQRAFWGSMLPWEFCPAFSSFIGLAGVKLLWGFPARYDIGHLRSLFRAMEQPFPLDFRAERDMTTLLDVAKRFLPGLEQELTAIREQNQNRHDALADAENQAARLQHVFSQLNIS